MKKNIGSKGDVRRLSLYKAIEHGKEHRKQYGTQGDYGKLVDKNCRNHGSCPYCEGNRNYNTRKRKQKADYSIKEMLED